jgi:superfamily II DNA or RNA helicase
MSCDAIGSEDLDLEIPKGIPPAHAEFWNSLGEVSTEKSPGHPSKSHRQLSYQSKIKAGILSGLKAGHRKGRVESPTGSGKTTMAVDLILQMQGKSLIVTPSLAAAERFYEEFQKRNPNKRILNLTGDKLEQATTADIVIVTGQTLINQVRHGSFAYKQMDPDLFSFIWMDESHMYFGEQMGAIDSHFSGFQVHCTATPNTRNHRLAEKVPHLHAEVRYSELVDNHQFPRRRYFRYKTPNEDMDKIEMLGDELQFKDEGEGRITGLNMPVRYTHLLHILEIMADRQESGIAFLPSIKSAKYFYENLVKANPKLNGKVAQIDGNTSPKRRDEIHRELESGKLTAAICVSLWSQSVDIPTLKHVILASNCMAPWLQDQRIGRACRYAPGKSEIYIHDIVSATVNRSHRPPCLPARCGTKRVYTPGMDLDDPSSNMASVDIDLVRRLGTIPEEIHIAEWMYEVDLAGLKEHPDLVCSVLDQFAKHFSVNPSIELLWRPEAFSDRKETIQLQFPKSRCDHPITFKDLYELIKLYDMMDVVADLLFSPIDAACNQIRTATQEISSQKKEGRSYAHLPKNPCDPKRLDHLVCIPPYDRAFFKIVFDTANRNPHKAVLVHPNYFSTAVQKDMRENPDAIYNLGTINGIHIQMMEGKLCIESQQDNMPTWLDPDLGYKGRFEGSIMVMENGELCDPGNQSKIKIHADLKTKINVALESQATTLVLSQAEAGEWLEDLQILCQKINNDISYDGMVFTKDKEGNVHMPLQCFYPEMDLNNPKEKQAKCQQSIIIDLLKALVVDDPIIRTELNFVLQAIEEKRPILESKTRALLKLFGVNCTIGLSWNAGLPGDYYDYYGPSNGGELQVRNHQVDFFDTPQSGAISTDPKKLQKHLQEIHRACASGEETLTLALREGTLETLHALQLYFFTHGYRGYGLLPVRISTTKIEISLKGIKVEKPKIQEFLPGRHIESKENGDGSKHLYRHGIPFAQQDTDGRLTWVENDFGKISIPASTVLNPRVITAATYDDSLGKVAWRREMVSMAKPALKDGWVICLPGWGREADMWLSQGVPEERLILVERETDLIEHLKRRYPRAMIINRPIESPKTLKDIARRPVDAVSVDPYAGLTPRFFTPLKKVLTSLSFSDTAFLGLNFQLRSSSRKNLEEMMETSARTQAYPDKSDKEVRELALWHAWRTSLPETHSRASFLNGQYEGDSAPTRMIYAMGIARKI